MATYNSIIQFRGKMGALSFYTRKGVPCVRRAGGIPKARMETDPSLRRIRAHHDEFAAQSMVSKSLRTSLRDLKRFWDGKFHNLLMSVGARITAMTPGEHGKRPLSLLMAATILKGLPFRKKRSLLNSLATEVKTMPSATRNCSRVHLEFNDKQVRRPAAAHTHYRFVHALAVVSDFEYEPALEGFVPVAYDVDSISAISWSDYIPVDQERVQVDLETTLPADRISDNATVVEVVGMEFYVQWPTGYEPITSGNAMEVVGVY